MDIALLMTFFVLLFQARNRLMMNTMETDGLPFFTDMIISPGALNWAMAVEYCMDHNRRLIVLDSQEKWDYFTAHNQYTENYMEWGSYWTGMRFNDTFDCINIDYTTQWVYNGWARWSNSTSEPEGCPERECVALIRNEMFTWECYMEHEALCETVGFDTTTEQITTSGEITSLKIETTTDDLSTYASTTEKDASLATTTYPMTEAESVQSSDTATSVTSTMPTTSSPEGSSIGNNHCSQCCIINSIANLDQHQKQEILDALRSELAVNETNLSSRRRKLISVYDSRPSSVTLGGVACVVLATVVGVIIVPDGYTLFRFLYKCFRSRSSRIDDSV